MILTRARITFICVVILDLSLVSCTTPDAVSKFSASAVTTLTSAKPVFNDMQQSCLRAVNSREGLVTFKLPTEGNTSCTEIGTQVVGVVAAVKILSDYFSAINALASFGSAKAGTDAEALLTKTATAFGANSATQTALGSIAKVLTSAATAGYQQKQLEKDLTKVSGNIPTVVDALLSIVNTDYLGALGREESDLSNRYLRFVRDNSTDKALSTEARLMLDDRWHADEAVLAAKRASAQSLVSALEVLSKGFKELAASAHQLTAKEVPGLLGPYVTQLQALIPQIQKAF